MAGTFHPTVIYLICRPFTADDYDDDDDEGDGDGNVDDDDEPIKRIKQVKDHIYNNSQRISKSRSTTRPNFNTL